MRRHALGRAAVIATLATSLSMGGFAGAGAAPPEATPLEKLHALVQPSVVYEQITWSGRVWDKFNNDYLEPFRGANEGVPVVFNVTFGCSGFVVSPDGYIATAGHCVEYDEQVSQAILAQAAEWAHRTHYYTGDFSLETIRGFAETDYQVRGVDSEAKRPTLSVDVAWGVAVSGLESGDARPARLAGFQKFDQGDAALLKIEADDLTPLELAPEEEIAVGTEIVSVGYAASVDAVTDVNFSADFKDGSVSNIRTRGGGLYEVYEISAAVSGGMSGGPTVDLQGRVIGINSFGILGEEQQFNFVSPASHLQELMADRAVANELGEVATLYREGVTAYFAGNRAAAISKLNQVLTLVPSHELAQEYLGKAQRLPVPPPPESNTMLFVLIGVAAILLLGGGALFMVMRDRRRRAPSAAPAAAVPPGNGPPGPTAEMAPPGAPVTTPNGPESRPVGFQGPAPEPVGVGAPAAPEGTTPEAAQEHSAPAPEAAAPAPMEAEAAPQMKYCTNCGTGNEMDAHFCQKCGHPFN